MSTRPAPALRALLLLTLRRTWVGAVTVASAIVLVTATAVVGYVAAYPDPADRLVLARSIGSNPGMSALFGETRALETIAGFTEWRVLLVLAFLAAIWALFASTRVLRGEEEAGRAEIVLAAPLTRTGALLATLGALSITLALLAVVAIGGLVVTIGADVGRGPAAALGVALVGVAAVMAALGALTSQLADTRRRAAGIGAAVLGAWYVIRVVADSTPDLQALRWATPLGWTELAAPLTDPAPGPLVLPFATALILGALTVLLVRRRDVGAGLLRGRDTARARLALLRSPLGLATRLARGTALSWALGMAAFGLLIGLVARTAAEAMAESTGGDLLGRLGIIEQGTRAYVGVSFVFITVALATAAAGQVAATRDEEGSNRLENILVRPVGRRRWLAGRLTVSVGLLVVAASAAGTGTWIAGRVGDLEVAGSDLALAAANALPAAVLVLGAGTLLHAIVPRRAAALTYAGVAASFLLEIVGSAVDLPSWVLNASVFHHVAPAPAVDPDWPAAAVLVALGAVAAGLGMHALTRRDIEAA